MGNVNKIAIHLKFYKTYCCAAIVSFQRQTAYCIWGKANKQTNGCTLLFLYYTGSCMIF